MTTRNTSRRAFITDAAKTTAAVALSATVLPSLANMVNEKKSTGIPYKQRPLLYGYIDLEVAIDAMTMEIHHDRHHNAYVTNLNKAVAGKPELEGKTVEQQNDMKTILNEIYQLTNEYYTIRLFDCRFMCYLMLTIAY